MRPVPIVEIHSEPGLNEIPCEASEVDQVRMRRIGCNGRPARNRIRRGDLSESVEAEKRKHHLDQDGRFSLKLKSHRPDSIPRSGAVNAQKASTVYNRQFVR